MHKIIKQNKIVHQVQEMTYNTKFSKHSTCSVTWFLKGHVTLCKYVILDDDDDDDDHFSVLRLKKTN